MRNLLPFLYFLEISNCPELESFPEGDLPSNLNELWVMNCPKLIAQRMKWNLHALQALKDFSIGDECGGGGVELFPEEGLLPSTLSSLRIIDFPHLKWLDIKGLQQLTSLEHLRIWKCRQLEKLPQQGELRELSDLRGEFYLKDLQNVVSAKDASEAKLMNKSYLEALPFVWNGLLPSLKTLYIEGLSGVMTIIAEFYGINSSSTVRKSFADGVASLESFSFSEMIAWEEWSTIEVEDVEVFPKLQELEINNCNKLQTVDWPRNLPCLTKLITDGDEVPISSLPRTPAISLLGVSCSSPVTFPTGCLPATLTGLAISRLMKWTLQALRALTQFTIEDNHEVVESFPEEGLLPSTLTSLKVSGLENLKSFET
nr:putative disease resistance protein At3g14460 [Ziziphus jujuba var. spinosa]